MRNHADNTWRRGRRHTAALASLLTLIGLLPLVALADVQVQLVDHVDPLDPANPWGVTQEFDPCGVTGLGSGQLLVTDCGENSAAETNGWVYTIADGTVANRPTGIDEPSGVDYDSDTDTLFVSSDDDQAVHVLEGFLAGAPQRRSIDHTAVPGAICLSDDGCDTEDPAFDGRNLHFLSGRNGQLITVAPGPDGFGPPDTYTTAMLTTLIPGADPGADWEGLAWRPGNPGTLLVADKLNAIVYELNLALAPPETLVETYLTTNIATLDQIGGLAVTQASFGSPHSTVWVADRGTGSPGTVSIIEVYLGTIPPVAPTAMDQSVGVQIDTPTPITLQATDLNGDAPLEYTYSQPEFGSVTGTGPNVTYTPNAGYIGSDSFTFTASDDGDLTSNEATVTLTVTAVNSPPVLGNLAASVDAGEGMLLELPVTATDPDLQPITYSLVNPVPAGTSIHPQTGLFRWIPSESQGGSSFSVTIRAQDNGAPPLSDQHVMTVKVAETNQAPVVQSPGTLTVSEGAQVSVPVTVTDSDVPANLVGYSASGLPTGLNVNASGVITGTVAAGAAAGSPNTVTYTATDNGSPSLSGSTTFQVNVTAGAGGGDPFTDDDGSQFEDDIEWLAATGITLGCNPPANDRFCPNDPVTRGQMATFLTRAFGYMDDGGGNRFVDDDSSVHEENIDRLATAGVTLGCNPPANDRFCPEDSVTRGQMASFLTRAFSYTDDGGGDLFRDDDGSVHELNIDRLGTAGVTRGCNPPANTLFCPDESVTRGQMAAFLHRAFGD